MRTTTVTYLGNLALVIGNDGSGVSVGKHEVIDELLLVFRHLELLRFLGRHHGSPGLLSLFLLFRHDVLKFQQLVTHFMPILGDLVLMPFFVVFYLNNKYYVTNGLSYL